MRLVAGSSAITLKLSSRMRCTQVIKGWYVSTKGILLIFSSVALLLERASLGDRFFMFSRSRFRVWALYPRLSKNEVISWALSRKSAWSEQMHRRRRSWLYGRLSLQWGGGDVMNRSAEIGVYQWLCSGWNCGCGHQKCTD